VGPRPIASVIQILSTAILSAAFFAVPVARAQSEAELALQREITLLRYAYAVVRVIPQLANGSASPNNGFGLVVGNLGRCTIVAAPLHVVAPHLRDDPIGPSRRFTDRPKVRFHGIEFLTDLEAEIHPDTMSIEDDLAWLQVRMPDNVAPLNPPQFATGTPSFHMSAWLIGNHPTEWQITGPGGHYMSAGERHRLVFAMPAAAPGGSGGAIVTRNGVLALFLETNGREAQGLSIQRIQSLFGDHFSAGTQNKLLASCLNAGPAERVRIVPRAPERPSELALQGQRDLQNALNALEGIVTRLEAVRR
jgi:hypothetical protein